MQRRHLMWLGVCFALVLGGLARATSKGGPVEAPTRIRGLLAALEDPDQEVVAAAMDRLVKEELAGPGVRPRLQAFAREPRMLELLRAQDWRIQLAAIQALETLGGESASVHLPLLVEHLRSNDEYIRMAAVDVLGKMGTAASAQLPRIADLLRHEDEGVRRTAVDVLGRMGESASAQSPRIVDLLKDEDGYVRQGAVEALGTLGPAASAQLPRIADLLRHEDERVREAAANALGEIGPTASAQVPRIADLLQDKNEDVCRAAVMALGKMGSAASAHAPRIVEFLQEARFRAAAANALRMMGPAASAQVPRIANLLQHERADVRLVAVDVLADMGPALRAQVPRLTNLLQDEDGHVRRRAGEVLMEVNIPASAHAPLIAELLQAKDVAVRRAAAAELGRKGAAASAQAPRLAEVLQDKDSLVRETAAYALGRMGKAASAQAPRIAELLHDEDGSVRGAALSALGEMGEAASAQAPRIAELLQHKDENLRESAVWALGKMGEAASAQAPRIAALLQDKGEGVRRAAVLALGSMGGAASTQVPHIAERLMDENQKVRGAAVRVLEQMGASANTQALLADEFLQHRDKDIRKAAGNVLLSMVTPDLQVVAAVLAAAEDDSANRAFWLLLAHAAGGGDSRGERLLQWVGRKQEELPAQLTVDEVRDTLRAFDDFWPETKKHPSVRKNLAGVIADVTLRARGQWEVADLELLVRQERNLRESHPKDADAVSAVIASLDAWRTLRNMGWTLAAHSGFWLLLLFFYPRSPQVQAFFFWNPWVRRITGFGYVGLLLTWVPFLRRRVMAPFGRLLLAEAQLERFSATTYFENSEVLLPASGRREPLLRVLPSLRGQIVLEGASGLGKSMFLKYLLAQSKRLTVYLPAERCKDGVLEAIQAKLEGHAKDATFLRSLIYSGALDIYIDGLNEVTADTRARIVQFVESNVHGNILLTTQPIEWTAPATASRYVLQPLSDEQVTRFLESREPVLGEKARLRGPAYLLACQRFVAEALSPAQPVELRQAHYEVLSNPMDLTVMAQMLAEERQPDLFHLRQQQYELMAREYREVHLDDFPLKAFSEEAYEMRCADRGVISEEKFGRELLRLEAAKMVVRQQWRSPSGQEQREWRFRHDKLQEFFIAQTFLGKDNPRAGKHLKDPRFRGVYLLLALLLEPQQAQVLRDMLVEHAAETRDHSVSDDFVTLLKKRQGAEKVRGNRSRGVA